MESPSTQNGFCHDCAQGGLIPAVEGFAQFIDDDGTPQHWYCRYCGSNHVTIKDEEGNSIFTQGDLYSEEAL